MDITGFAWCAGFFDGEGSTCVQTRGKSVRMQISVGQVERLLLDRFHRIVKVGNVHGPSGAKYQYRAWTLEQVQQVICYLWPYLGPFKRDQYKLALKTYLAEQGKARRYEYRANN